MTPDELTRWRDLLTKIRSEIVAEQAALSGRGVKAIKRRQLLVKTLHALDSGYHFGEIDHQRTLKQEPWLRIYGDLPDRIKAKGGDPSRDNLRIGLRSAEKQLDAIRAPEPEPKPDPKHPAIAALIAEHVTPLLARAADLEARLATTEATVATSKRRADLVLAGARAGVIPQAMDDFVARAERDLTNQPYSKVHPSMPLGIAECVDNIRESMPLYFGRK
jgi:hypothetical protein